MQTSAPRTALTNSITTRRHRQASEAHRAAPQHTSEHTKSIKHIPTTSNPRKSQNTTKPGASPHSIKYTYTYTSANRASAAHALAESTAPSSRRASARNQLSPSYRAPVTSRSPTNSEQSLPPHVLSPTAKLQVNLAREVTRSTSSTAQHTYPRRALHTRSHLRCRQPPIAQQPPANTLTPIKNPYPAAQLKRHQPPYRSSSHHRARSRPRTRCQPEGRRAPPPPYPSHQLPREPPTNLKRASNTNTYPHRCALHSR